MCVWCWNPGREGGRETLACLLASGWVFWPTLEQVFSVFCWADWRSEVKYVFEVSERLRKQNKAP